MGQIDFVKQQHPGDDGSPSGKRPFDVEYTNPDAEPGTKPAVNHTADEKKKFSWFGLQRSNDQVMDVELTTPAPVAPPQPVASQPVAPLPSPLPKPLPVAPPPLPPTPTPPPPPLPKPQPPMPKPVPVAPPPPPVPAPKPVAPIHELAPQPPAAPAAPAAPAFATPGAPAKAAASAHSQKRLDDDEIVARNVSHLRGEQTNPEPLPSSDFMVNLLPMDLFNAMNPMVRIAGLIKTALVTVVCMGVVYGVILGYQSYYLWQTRANQLEIERTDRDILKYQDLQISLTETSDTLTDVSTILGQHVYWSNILTLLEQYTLPNVYFSSLSASTTGQITVQAITSDFASVTKQVETLRQARSVINPSALVFSGVQVDTVSRNAITLKEDEKTKTNTNVATTVEPDKADVTAFTLSFKVDPSLLNYQPLYEF